MIHTILLPLFGLLGIYYTFCTLISFTSNRLLLIFPTLPAIFIQITFIDLILPYPIHFITQYVIKHYLFSLSNTFFSNLFTTSYKKIMLPIPFLLSSQHRSVHSFTQDVTPFLNNIIFQYTNPLPFETEAHSIHTIPLLREHFDSYLFYFRYKTLEIIPSQKPFQPIFIQYKMLTQEHFFNDTITLNIGSNKICYKSQTFNTNFFRTSY